MENKVEKVEETGIERKDENPVAAFFEANKKWFIIGGCFLGGILLGGAGMMVMKKAGEENDAIEEELS